MQYTECTTCLYAIVDGAFQETSAESCAAICAAENATVVPEAISGQDDPRLNGTITCFAALGQCSSIPFYVNPNNESASILVTNSPPGEFFDIVQQRHFAMIECMGSKCLYLFLCHSCT